jgi:hypothetical protein
MIPRGATDCEAAIADHWEVELGDPLGVGERENASC